MGVGAGGGRVSTRARASLVRDLDTVRMRLLNRIRRIYRERRSYQQVCVRPFWRMRGRGRVGRLFKCGCVCRAC